MTDKIFMVFDVESIGLHGEGFAAGYVVIREGREVESGFYRCQAESANGTNEDYAWVERNVVHPMQKHVDYGLSDGTGSKSPREVRENFWGRWMEWRERGAMLAADVAWPVEARFLADCVKDDPIHRASYGPYPMIDIASVRMAVGLDPLATLERLQDENPPHHPLSDARQSARLLLEALALSPVSV